MREILFRAKRKDNGELVEGFPVFDFANCSLKKSGKCVFEHNGDLLCFYSWIDNLHEYDEIDIDPSTICQYTGLKDKNDKKIYEGDICKTKFFGKENGNGQNSADYDIFKIVYKHGSYLLESNLRQFSASYIEDMAGSGGIEVIGNIYDNPELIESKVTS